MDDDEDKLLLSSLGVASANPEDIERKVIAEVTYSNLLLCSGCNNFVANTVKCWFCAGKK